MDKVPFIMVMFLLLNCNSYSANPGETDGSIVLPEPCANYECDTMVVRSILDKNGLKDRPVYDFIQDIPGRVNVLNFYDEPITIIPPEIGRLVYLDHLFIGKTKVTELPDEIIALKKLHDLDCIKAQLKTLPEKIGELSGITHLTLSGNQLTSIPESIRDLDSLIFLGLSNNRIEEFPSAICECKGLTKLSMSNNNLTSLPDCIVNLDSCEFFISHNKLCNLKPEIINFINARVRYPNWKDTQDCD